MPIPSENKKGIEDLACYLVRAPLSLQKLVYLDRHRADLAPRWSGTPQEPAVV